MQAEIQNIIHLGEDVATNNAQNSCFGKDRARHAAVDAAAKQIMARAKEVESERANALDLVQRAILQANGAIQLFSQGNYTSIGQAMEKCVRVQELLTEALGPLS